MKLYKTSKSPYWHYDFTINGKRERGSTKRLLTDKVGANRTMMQMYQSKLDRVALGLKPDITMQEAVDHTLEEVTGQTLRLYECTGRRLVAHFGPSLKLSAMRQTDLDGYVSLRKRQGVKGNTIKADIKTLHRVVNKVSRSYLVNPELDYPQIKGFTKTRYLTQSEEEAVLSALRAKGGVTAQKAYDLAVCLLDTGLRLNEAVTLQWRSINLTDREIEVYRTKTSSLSMVPISDRLYNILKRLHNQAAPFEQMSQAVRDLRTVIRDLCNNDRRTNETRGDATIHSLRDTFATRMVQRGMTLHRLSKLLGHTSVAMSAKYGHLESGDVVDEARRLMNGR